MAVPALLLTAAIATWTVDAGTSGILFEDHRAPVVTVTVEFPLGSWSPWTRAHHAADAFVFQDSDPVRALRKRADALAAQLELEMDDRFSSLTLRCLKDDLDAALTLARDVLANTKLDPRELKRAGRERAILWHANETDVSFRVAQASARLLFSPDDPRRLPYEKLEKVSTNVKKLVATRDLLIRMPGRVIGFAGDLTPEEAKRAAAGLLPAPHAEVPEGTAPRLGPIAPGAARDRTRDVAIRNLTQAYLTLARDSLPWDDPRRPALLVADHVLAGHFYSRLYVALRHEAGDTYGAGTRESGDVVPDVYAASTFTRASNAGAVAGKLTAAVATFRERGITEDERERAIAFLRGNRAFARQSAGQLLDRYLTERRLGLPPGFLDGQIDRAAEVPLDEINAFIFDYFDPAQFSLLRAVPQ